MLEIRIRNAKKCHNNLMFFGILLHWAFKISVLLVHFPSRIHSKLVYFESQIGAWYTIKAECIASSGLIFCHRQTAPLLVTTFQTCQGNMAGLRVLEYFKIWPKHMRLIAYSRWSNRAQAWQAENSHMITIFQINGLRYNVPSHSLMMSDTLRT